LHVVGRLKNRTGRALADRLLQSGVGPEADAMRAASGRLGQLSRTPPRVVGFVGAQAGLAATAAACAFARAAARDGQNVLLIDQDPASGAMARVLGEPGGRLGEVMSGAASWRDCVSPDRIPGLDTLVGSAKPQADVAGNIVGLENLLAEARADYDQIVLGAAGTGEVEATRIVRSSDVTVVVLEESAMRARPAAEAIARLRTFSRSPLAAFLLTRS
jgi:MinD-like ATPase involved in chromosome partitioning or flagellar assembly